jgi:hypothetical protein
MCKCAFTTFDVMSQINDRREKNNLTPMPYGTFMAHYQTIANKLPPDTVIGRNYIFRKGKTKKIVSAIWKKKYRQTIDWYAWKKVA